MFLGGFTLDITEEKRAQKKIDANQDNLEDLVNERTAELKESSQTLEESRTALTYLLEDVNSAREELLEVNRKMEFANKELEAFAHSVSHDLRAPLRHINGFIDILFDHLVDKLDEIGKEYFINIKESSQNMGKLIDQLLVFSRMGRVDLNRIKIDHIEIINEALKLLKTEIDDSKIDFEIKPLGIVYADPFLLRQVWVNLISNAIKFTRLKKTPKIEIGFEKEGKEKITYYIKDNGIGFDNKFAEKAFQVFQRLHSNSEYPGIGVGLANVSRIIQRHGGIITAKAAVNKGATFSFTIPDPMSKN